jgi:hypothetical protein
LSCAFSVVTERQSLYTPAYNHIIVLFAHRYQLIKTQVRKWLREVAADEAGMPVADHLEGFVEVGEA